MSDLTGFHGPNAAYALELYDRYRANPDSVDSASRALFESWVPPDGTGVAAPKAAPEDGCDFSVVKVVAAARVARLVRELGHLAARIDPLGSAPHGDPGLDPATHGISDDDLAALPPAVVGGPLAEGAANALEAVRRLRRAYSGAIGYEEDHVQIAEEREWIREAVETGRFFQGFGPDDRRDLLARLTEVDTFERFLHRMFVGQKWFSIEGTDMLVPILDLIIRDAAAASTREVVMGMAHRGRLNVLAHILGKPYGYVLAEFKAAKQEEGASVSGSGTRGWSGDVKYHLGAKLTYREEGVQEMPITLAPNPSHLEYVNPVVTGRARAAQETLDAAGLPVQDLRASLAILIHGDAAFPGEGIVSETLNLSQLPGFRVGGTIHIIANNQIGFTTGPRDGRSTLYASDLAKGFEIPIVHVNADEPEACLAAARMAFAYRERFGKDFLIDLVGYRRFGHNEGDPPEFTQPRIYEIIASHPRVREIWAARLQSEGLVTAEQAEAMVQASEQALQEAYDSPPPAKPPAEEPDPGVMSGRVPAVTTAVPAERLTRLNEALASRPVGFAAVAKLETILARRRDALSKPGGIDWGHAESLAFASILEDGTPVRISGQDTERGTFLHRNAVLHDPASGRTYTPLQTLSQARAAFAVYNSPLSENAVLGFEYGYSMHKTSALVLWEAQFGDFANSAQVIVDQFIVSGNAKWQQTPSLVLLLPHGYEGQGPEHSSARLERFLQLCANDNIRVVNCTTAAQYFHVLRRQAALVQTDPRPLIVMTPKYLLRHPRAGSSLVELAEGGFHPVIGDESARGRAKQVTRLILCSGKVWTNLVTSATSPVPEWAAVARIEQLYPFPVDELTEVIASYPSLREVVWLQEEPSNMGAWDFVAPRIRVLLDRGMLRYVGRAASASPAEGSLRQHEAEQARILATAVSPLAPSDKSRSRRSPVSHVR